MAMPCCKKVLKTFGLNTFFLPMSPVVPTQDRPESACASQYSPGTGSCCSWQEHGWEGAEQPQLLPMLRNSWRRLEAWQEVWEAGGTLTTGSVRCGLNSQFSPRKLHLLQQSTQLSSEKVDLSIRVSSVRSFIYYELENVGDFLLNWCLSELN